MTHEVTFQDLTDKYGSIKQAAKEYLRGNTSDEEAYVVEHKIQPTTVLFAKVELLEEKIDLLINMIGRIAYPAIVGRV